MNVTNRDVLFLVVSPKSSVFRKNSVNSELLIIKSFWLAIHEKRLYCDFIESYPIQNIQSQWSRVRETYKCHGVTEFVARRRKAEHEVNALLLIDNYVPNQPV